MKPVILSEASQSDAKSKDPEDAGRTTTAPAFLLMKPPALDKLDLPRPLPRGASL